MPYKGELEVWYTKHRNVFMYWKLIFMTVEAVFKPESKSWIELEGIPEVPENLKGII